MLEQDSAHGKEKQCNFGAPGLPRLTSWPHASITPFPFSLWKCIISPDGIKRKIRFCPLSPELQITLFLVCLIYPFRNCLFIHVPPALVERKWDLSFRFIPSSYRISGIAFHYHFLPSGRRIGSEYNLSSNCLSGDFILSVRAIIESSKSSTSSQFPPAHLHSS